jgi:cell division protease FtsH
MSEKLGLVALEGPRTPLFLPVPTYPLKEYGEGTADLIDGEIKKILVEAHLRVKEIFTYHQTVLEELAKLLLEREVVERLELQAILKVRSIDSVKEKKRRAESNRAGEQMVD